MIDVPLKFYQVSRIHGPIAASKIYGAQFKARLRGGQESRPAGIPDQRDLINKARESSEPTWIIWFDGGRYDYFEELYPEYFEGTLRKAWNGGVGYTGDWSMRNLRQDFEGWGLFSMADLQSFGAVPYDSSEHFDVTPHITYEDNSSMEERLAYLGYAELGDGGNAVEREPLQTNDVIREHLPEVKSGVIRYLKPHPPFYGLEEMTMGASKVRETRKALYAGQLSHAELVEAYVSTYRGAFEAALDIIPDLEGRVIITADHGECLTCGQLFHGRYMVMHDHLVEVPWFEVDRP